jgi:hypothetical protein
MLGEPYPASTLLLVLGLADNLTSIAASAPPA